MRTSKVLAISVALAASFAANPAQAQVDGWFDAVYVQMVDTAYGWICDESNPYSPPAGTLVVYLGGSKDNGGTFYYEYPLNNGNWSRSRPEVSWAGYCGGNAAAGWEIIGWFGSPMYIYYRHPDGTLQELGGSGKLLSRVGMNY